MGAAPLKALFERVAAPLGTPETPGTRLAGRRMVAVDGTCLDLADTVENDAHFGRPGVNKGGRSAFPQVRVVAPAECGTHAMFAAELGPYGESESVLFGRLLVPLGPDMLILGDRGFFSYALWAKASATGADLLWRVRTDSAGPKPGHVRDLPEGSWLAVLRKAGDRTGDPMPVRVIDYTVQDGRANAETYRLFHDSGPRGGLGNRSGGRLP